MRVTLATFWVIFLEFLCSWGLAQSIQCKENEEFQECGSGCPLTCKNYTAPLFCTENCKTGCFCRPGYVKGPDDKCIRPSQCPIGPCKEGEVPSTCVNPCNNCIQKGKCYFEYCIKGCDCKPGYFRNPTDICVAAEKCGSETHLCPPNEHYVKCLTHCHECWARGPDCSASYDCQPGCDCNPGYYRDDYGTCVLEEQCDSHDAGCGPNEIFTDCVNTCNDCEHKGHCDHYDCHYGCDCKRGYFRNHDGLCISESECAATMCGHYEEYSECGSACPISCDNYNKQVPCTLHCVKGCFCSQGYIRGPGGKCIRPSECPRVCGEYEEYMECGTSCPLHCSNITSHSSTPCSCVKGCFCKAGYVRGPNGKCILQSACPPICGNYEEYRECGSGCIATCENRAHIGDCSLPCTKGCFCVAGYIRGPDEKCILPESCPPVCGRNEEYQDCGSACPANCTNQNPICREVCVRGCFCKPGYIRDPYGICVLPSNCPLLCDQNEIFMSCGPRCEPSCDAIHRNPALCPGCQKGCFCKPGYVRGPNGKCILPISCPAACGENEEFKDCGSACPANCSNPTPICPKVCVRGCFCKPGFIRNSNYACILPESCPVVCGEYEAFSQCGTSCPPTCANRNPTCPAQCVSGCFCTPGYVKDDNGKCILPAQCPQKCQDNASYRLCGTSCPITCDNIGKSVSCKLHCNRGCFCNDGYVKGPNGICVTPELCPMRCGQHEVLKECGTACQLTCANYTSPGPCAAPCVKGCFCRRGYVRNARGKCILTKHCPARCHENEVFTCSSLSCEVSCDDDDDRPRSCIGDCTNGCYCRRGFVRAPDGKCVLRSQCPRVIDFDGRNKGGEENDAVATLSSTLLKTKSLFTTKANLDLLTKLHVTVPLVGEPLDEAVSTPANAEQASLHTPLSSISFSTAKETAQMAIITKALPISSENPAMAMATKSPQKLLDNPTMVRTTKSPQMMTGNPIMASSTKSSLKSSENPIATTTELPQGTPENPTMAMKSLAFQTTIQNSIASKPSKVETDKASVTELESSTSPMNVNKKTSNFPMSTVSTVNGSTV